MRPRLKVRLGGFLVHETFISSEQLVLALAALRTSGRQLGGPQKGLGFFGEPQLLPITGTAAKYFL
jgi:hypothetical protein